MARPRRLHERPQRPHEPLVDEARRQRPSPAHEARRVRHRQFVDRRRSRRLSARPRSLDPRPREVDRHQARGPDRVGLRPDARALGEGSGVGGQRRASLARRRPRRVHDPRPRVRRARAADAGPHGRRRPPQRHPLPRGGVHARRRANRRDLRRVRRTRDHHASRKRRRRARTQDDRRRHRALARSAFARRKAHRAHRQAPAPLGARPRERNEHARRGEHRRPAHGSRVVARQPVACVRIARRVERQHAGAAVAGRGRQARRRDHGPLRQLQAAVERRRQVPVLPVEPLVPIRRGQPVGRARARTVPRDAWARIRARAEARRAVAVHARR